MAETDKLLLSDKHLDGDAKVNYNTNTVEKLSRRNLNLGPRSLSVHAIHFIAVLHALELDDQPQRRRH